MNQDDIIKRLDDFVEFEVMLSPTSFATKAGIDPPGFIKMLKGQQKITTNTLKKISACYNLNMNYILYGEGDMYLPKEKSIAFAKDETRPRVPLTAAAGSLSGDNASVTLKECEQLPVISQMPSYDYTIVIKGDSMMPKYESGDEVACRRIDQTRFIQWGKVHVLDTTQGIIIKRIYEEGDCIKCVSFNPDYPPFLIPKSDIYSMGLVVGSLSITEM